MITFYFVSFVFVGESSGSNEIEIIIRKIEVFAAIQKASRVLATHLICVSLAALAEKAEYTTHILYAIVVVTAHAAQLKYI